MSFLNPTPSVDNRWVYWDCSCSIPVRQSIQFWTSHAPTGGMFALARNRFEKAASWMREQSAHYCGSTMWSSFLPSVFWPFRNVIIYYSSEHYKNASILHTERIIKGGKPDFFCDYRSLQITGSTPFHYAQSIWASLQPISYRCMWFKVYIIIIRSTIKFNTRYLIL